MPATIAHERLTNPFAAESEESSFVKFALKGLGSYPRYHRYMADINGMGPDNHWPPGQSLGRPAWYQWSHGLPPERPLLGITGSPVANLYSPASTIPAANPPMWAKNATLTESDRPIDKLPCINCQTNQPPKSHTARISTTVIR